MDTFKIFLNTYRTALYYALLGIVYFIFMMVMQVSIPSELEEMYRGAWFFCLMPPIFSLGRVCEKLYEKKLLYLLPVSRSTKFFMPFGIAFLAIILNYFLVIPMEAVAHLFTTGYAPERQIVIGGFLRYCFINNAMLVIPLVVSCANIFVYSLVRDKIATTVILMGGLFGIWIYKPEIWDFIIKPYAMSTNAIIGCLAASALLIVASYLLFKRWQPANDGIFRI